MTRLSLYYTSSIMVILLLLVTCTTNPFSEEDPIEKNVRTVSGNVQLSDQVLPDSIYVWLEDFDIGTFTDNNGNFKLNLPSPQEQPGGGVSGMFDLYFYVVNYEIQSVQVALKEGEFLFGEAGIDNSGRLNKSIVLIKLLDVNTTISPTSVTADFRDSLFVTITLSSTLNRTTQISAIMNQDKIISGIFIRHLTLRNRFLDQYIMTGSRIQSEFIGSIPKRSVSVYRYHLCELPKGTYEIIPFVWVIQDDIPVELINNFTSYPVLMSPEYLNLPYKLVKPKIKIEYCDHSIGDPP